MEIMVKITIKGLKTMFENFKIAKFDIILKAGEEGLSLPPYKGSTLRGGFGSVFKRIACAQRDADCQICMLRATCPYTYIFETFPPDGSNVLRNYESVPRPFVLEPPLETKTVYNAGEVLQFNLILFGKAITYLPYFVIAFKELGEVGIGKGRKGFELIEIAAVNELVGQREVIYSADSTLVRNVDLSIKGSDILEHCSHLLIEELLIEFKTMSRLKYDGQFVRQVPFHILIRNLLRRLSSIYYFHHGVRQEGDYKDLIQEAEKVTTTFEETKWVDWERYSSRHDKKMNLGGIVGTVCYQVELAEFMPLLVLGQWSHVGKACTFGMGKYVAKNVSPLV
jgi:hypothetical protein